MLVLYPEDLRSLGRVYDELCEELAQKGAWFSREALAQRILAEVFDPGKKANAFPHGETVH